MHGVKNKAVLSKDRVAAFLARYGILLALILLLVIVTFVNFNFWTPRNLINVIRLASINGFLAIGMTFIVLTGGIDLSVGSVMGTAGIVAALLARQSVGLPWYIPCMASIAVGLLFGAINGIMVAYLRVPAFVATLGMLSVAKGITYLLNNAKPVPNLSSEFLAIGGGSILGIPNPTWVFFIVLLVSAFMLYKRPFGRYVFAIGGNESAARASGIDVKKNKWKVYVISGLLAALAGIIMTSRVSSGIASTGEGYETDAIAAAVIGGTSLSGGKGRLWGTVVGIFIMTVMNNILDLTAVNAYIQLVVKGAIIVLAVLIDSISSDKE